MRNDFPIEADGILGIDFISKHQLEIIANERIKLYGITWPIESARSLIVLKPRSEMIIQASTISLREEIANKKEIDPGIHLGGCVTGPLNGKCLVGVINTRDAEVVLHDLVVDLEPLPSMLRERKNLFTISSDSKRIEMLREKIRTNHLNKEEKEALLAVYEENCDIFFLEGDALSSTDAIKHEVNTHVNMSLANTKPYKLPEKHKREVNNQVQEMLKNDIIL